MNHFALEVKKISCGYGSKFRISAIDFAVDKGSFTSIIGPNGSGKTTLFRGISGMLPIEEGEVLLEGNNLTALSHKARARKIAIVNQSVEAGAMIIEDYVLMGRLPYRTPLSFFETKQDYEIAEENMRLTGVWEKRHKWMNQLSGGEQQRVLISRALCQKTKIIFFDEPTSALDYAHQIHVMDTLYELCTQGISIVMVSHDLNLAAMYAHKVLLLHQGQILTCATPDIALTQNNLEKLYACPLFVDTHPITQTVRVSYIPKNTTIKKFPND